MPDIDRLCEDLGAEHAALDPIVASLEEEAWDLETPAHPWTIRDQIAHLSFFDLAARTAAADPAAFAEGLAEAAADIQRFMDAPLEEARRQPVSGVLSVWRQRRTEMLEAFSSVPADARIPWYGPPMSPASFISARLMETWAHGQDIVDALGVERASTDRLFHVAHLGVRARRFSYVANSMDYPGGDVRVELESPSGDVWSWGESSDNVVRGSALGFCLLVTQRRHLDDVDVTAEGPLAVEWMSIAQCFAGPPGEGRQPGQFS